MYNKHDDERRLPILSKYKRKISTTTDNDDTMLMMAYNKNKRHP
jgi:hypothetical protein